MTKVEFQVQVGNEKDGWVSFGATRKQLKTAQFVAERAKATYVNARSIDTRIVRITTVREVIEEGGEADVG